LFGGVKPASLPLTMSEMAAELEVAVRRAKAGPNAIDQSRASLRPGDFKANRSSERQENSTKEGNRRNCQFGENNLSGLKVRDANMDIATFISRLGVSPGLLKNSYCN